MKLLVKIKILKELLKELLKFYNLSLKEDSLLNIWNTSEKLTNVSGNKNDINLEKEDKKFDDKKNKKIKNLSKKRKIELQSYKIIFILKDVDPKDPTEELSSILSNSEVNFEIEKIERILDSKNKK